jgi:hypothetical protein
MMSIHPAVLAIATVPPRPHATPLKNQMPKKSNAAVEVTDEPIGYFITWTVYGTFLQGDMRWWRKRGAGEQAPRPRLEHWHRDRLKHDIILLSDQHRDVVFSEIEYHCKNRQWKLWVANPRTNHVHVVVTAPGYFGKKVRDQLKANCTGGLRQDDKQFTDRPVWSVGGDVQVLETNDDLDQAAQYAGEAQDRMGRGK